MVFQRWYWVFKKFHKKVRGVGRSSTLSDLEDNRQQKHCHIWQYTAALKDHRCMWLKSSWLQVWNLPCQSTLTHHSGNMLCCWCNIVTLKAYLSSRDTFHTNSIMIAFHWTCLAWQDYWWVLKWIFQWGYRVVKEILHWCYNRVKGILLIWYWGVTGLFKMCYMGITGVLYRCFMGVSEVL